MRNKTGAKNRKRCALFGKLFIRVSPRSASDRTERKHDQAVPRYKNPLGMNHRLHRLLALYHHVEPSSDFFLVVIRPRHVEYLLQVLLTVFAFSTHCPTACQWLLSTPPSGYSFILSPCVIQDPHNHLLAHFTVMSNN